MDKITSEEQLQSLIGKSSSEAVIILKHSTQCSLCTQAYSEAESFEASHPDVSVGYIVVQEHRALANQLADMTGVKHQTPQAFLYHKGEAKWNASHRKVTEEELEKQLQEIQ